MGITCAFREAAKSESFMVSKRKCVLGKPISPFSLFSTSSLGFLVPSRAIPSGQDIKVCKDGGKNTETEPWEHCKRP